MSHEQLLPYSNLQEVLHIMKKIIINENQRGFLFKNGKYIKMLTAGKYLTFGGKEIEVAEPDMPIVSKKCALERIRSDRVGM